MDLIVDIDKIEKHEASLYLITTIKTLENMSLIYILLFSKRGVHGVGSGINYLIRFFCNLTVNRDAHSNQT